MIECKERILKKIRERQDYLVKQNSRYDETDSIKKRIIYGLDELAIVIRIIEKECEDHD